MKFMAWYFLMKTSHVELLNITYLTAQHKARGGGLDQTGDLHRCLVTVEGAEIQKENNLNRFHLKGLASRGQEEASAVCEPPYFGAVCFLISVVHDRAIPPE